MNYIDLRSDTVTEPTLSMREAMLHAVVGDDVYEDDPTVKELEQLAATLTGKEAALFVPSGTMGNQLAIMTHTHRGEEIIAAKDSHVVWHEVGAIAVLSSVMVRTIPDEIMTADSILNAIRIDDIHEPKTTLLCMENALGSGIVIDLKTMKENYTVAKENGLNVHLDGARLFNAAISLNVEPKEITQYTDSVMFCISKGLCSPIGSLLCGSKDFIAKSKKNRKLLGGGLRQAGFLAACGIISLTEMTKRLQIDHDNAKYLASELYKRKYISIDLNRVQINMVFFKILSSNFNETQFIQYALQNNIKLNGSTNGLFRLVTHHGITKEDIQIFLNRLDSYFEKNTD